MPEPNKPGEPERRQGSRESGNPATKWVAIGSIAAVAAAAIAFLAYAIPRPSVSPTPVSAPTAPVTVAYLPEAPTYSPSYSPSSPPPVPTTPAPSPSPAVIQAGRPAGCDDAFAVINAYNQTAGATTNSEQSAASQAYQSLMPDSLEANDEAVSNDITDLAADFSTMSAILQGALTQNYSGAVRQTNSDIKTLDGACAIS